MSTVASTGVSSLVVRGHARRTRGRAHRADQSRNEHGHEELPAHRLQHHQGSRQAARRDHVPEPERGQFKRLFGAKSAPDYLIGEKLITFADAARDHPPFAKELPRVLATIWQVFNEYEIAGYVASRKPLAMKRLRQLLYLR